MIRYFLNVGLFILFTGSVSCENQPQNESYLLIHDERWIIDMDEDQEIHQNEKIEMDRCPYPPPDTIGK